MARTLTPKQAAFVREYQVDLNATQAAIRAGYAEASAHVTGSTLLRHPKVSIALAKVREGAAEVVAERTGEAILTAAAVAERAWAIANEDRPDRVSALALLAKQFPEFSDKVDARVLHGMGKVERGTRGLA